MLCLGNDYKLLQVRNFAGLRKRQKRSFDRGQRKSAELESFASRLQPGGGATGEQWDFNLRLFCGVCRSAGADAF